MQQTNMNSKETRKVNKKIKLYMLGLLKHHTEHHDHFHDKTSGDYRTEPREFYLAKKVISFHMYPNIWRGSIAKYLDICCVLQWWMQQVGR